MRKIISSICVGSARPFRGDETSAIAKQPVEGLLKINTDGFVLDEQADRSVHGGPEMAIHLYPLDHHRFWREKIGDHPLLGEPGAFGSNLAVSGLGERDVHIGDRFRLGSALLEISQPRQPCWKIEHRFGEKGMVAAIVKSGRCGWYFRVLQEGSAKAGDSLEPLEVGASDWTVERTFLTIFSGSGSRDDLRAVSQLQSLAPKLRAKVAAKLEA